MPEVVADYEGVSINVNRETGAGGGGICISVDKVVLVDEVVVVKVVLMWLWW